MAATILITLSLDQNQKLLINVRFDSVFALEKTKIIKSNRKAMNKNRNGNWSNQKANPALTLYKRSAYCF